MKRPLKKLPSRLFLFLAAFLFFSFLSNDFGLVDIQKTAIVLAAGIDRTEEGYEVTAQIAVPSSAQGGSGGATSGVNISGEGETVAEAIAQIYAETGWVPKLIFCNLILIGEETAEEDVFSFLGFFLRNEYMSDTCRLALCEGKAKAILSAPAAVDDTSSSALEKLFSDAAEKSGYVANTTLKDFAVGYYGVSESGFMPYIRAMEQPAAKSAGGQGQEENGAAQGKSSALVYSADETALFSRGKFVALLAREETFAYNLLCGKVFAGSFPVETDEGAYSLDVLKNKGSARPDERAERALFSVSVRARVYDRNTPSGMKEITSAEVVPPSVAREAEKRIEKTVLSLWEKCADSDCDLFFLARQLYRSDLRLYREKGGLPLTSLSPSVQAEVVGIR